MNSNVPRSTPAMAGDETDDLADGPSFRMDNEQLAFRFTATLSDRNGTPVERLPTPRSLERWLAVNGLIFDSQTRAKGADLTLAQELREAIHRAGTSAADKDDIALVNGLARDSETFPELGDTGVRWHTRSRMPIRAALGLIAQDAITVLGGATRAQVKSCENPECRGLYVDTSRAQNRRWCSMNFCGNRAKKAKFRRPDRPSPGTE